MEAEGGNVFNRLPVVSAQVIDAYPK